MPPRRTRKAAAKATAETKITVPVAVVEEKVEKAVENLDLAESNDMETDQVPEGATKEAAEKDKKPKQEREEEHVLFPFPEKSAETTMNGIRRMYYAANFFAIQNKLNKPSGGPIVNGALRCQQKGKHLNSTEKYARHVMDVCIQTYQNNEKFMKNAKGKKATHDNRKWKVTSYFCSSVALSARSEFLMNKIVEGRLLNQLHGTSKNGHYVVLKMPRIFNSVVPKLLAWMHGGKLILKKAQIKLFIRALSFFQIMLPHKCVQELCDIIGHRWVFPKRKNFKKEKKEQQAKEAKEGEAKEQEADAAEAPAETETDAKEEETSQNKENEAETCVPFCTLCSAKS